MFFKSHITLIFLSLITFSNSFSQCITTEIVRNGSFEQGYLDGTSNSESHNFTPNGPLDFYSDLGYKTNVDQTNCNWAFGDSYGVSNNHEYTCSFQTFKGLYYGSDYMYLNKVYYDSLVHDHTLGAGQNGFMLVTDQNDLMESLKYPGEYPLLWEQEISVQPNTLYLFSAFIASWSALESDSLRIIIREIDNSDNVSNIEYLSLISLREDTLLVYEELKDSWMSGTNSLKVRIGIEIMTDGFATPYGGNDFLIDDISFKTNNCITSLNKNKNEQIEIFPNPANEQILINGNFKEWELININSQIISNGHINQVNLNSIPSGIYFLNIDGHFYKFIKE